MYRKLLIAASVASLAALGSAHAQQQMPEGGAGDSKAGECASPPPNPPQCDELRKMQLSDATVEGELTVGMAVPDTVVLLDVPNYTTYKAAMINGKRVFIDPSNRTIVEIVE
jgi:hypothetical protein